MQMIYNPLSKSIQNIDWNKTGKFYVSAAEMEKNLISFKDMDYNLNLQMQVFTLRQNTTGEYRVKM